MKNILLLIFSLYSFGLALDKLSVAVIDFEGHGILPDEALTLTEKFRSELVSLNKFNVVERSQMQTILKEQGFQQTGLCNDEACIINMGQLIGVSCIVSGSIGKVGKVFLVTVRLINVQSGIIMKNVNIEIKGGIEDVLSEGIQNAVARLSEFSDDKKIMLNDTNDLIQNKSSPPNMQKAKTEIIYEPNWFFNASWAVLTMNIQGSSSINGIQLDIGRCLNYHHLALTSAYYSKNSSSSYGSDYYKETRDITERAYGIGVSYTFHKLSYKHRVTLIPGASVGYWTYIEKQAGNEFDNNVWRPFTYNDRYNYFIDPSLAIELGGKHWAVFVRSSIPIGISMVGLKQSVGVSIR